MAQSRNTLVPVLLTFIVTFSIMCAFRESPVLYSHIVQKDETKTSSDTSEGNTSNSSQESAKRENEGDRVCIEKVDFNALFHNVPYALNNCRDLSKNWTLPADFEEDFADFVAETKIQGPTTGHTGQPEFRELYILMQHIASARFVKTVCETGFNGGHSSFAWLSNSNAQVYSFDIGAKKYGRAMAAYLQQKFPGRHRVTWGDSRETLPRFREENPDVRCDLILIDGGHYYDVVRSDFENFRKMAKPVNILIMDNYPDQRFMWMGDMWEHAKRSSQLFEFFTCNYWGEDPEGMSFGRFVV